MLYDAINAARRDFRKRHGDDAMEMPDAPGWVLFSDGAQMEINPMGGMQEPPDDLLQCLKLQRMYWEELVRRLTGAFDHLKAETLRNVHAGNDFPEQKDQLKQLESEGKACQAKLDAVQQQINDHPKERVRATSQAAAEAYKARLVAEIEAIRL